VVCGMPVWHDDAIGVLPTGISHAECALVRMLETAEAHESKHRRAPSTRLRSRVSDAHWSALLHVLEESNNEDHPR
jgi:hypothetical protein